MSKVIDGAVEALNRRLDGEGVDGSVRFVIGDEGAVRVDETGARTDEVGAADCTITASRETFEGLLAGAVNPTTAFMTGRLKVEGDMALAMKLGSLIA
jgi:putative sterol carrier protein